LQVLFPDYRMWVRFAIAVLNLVLLGTTRLGKIGDMD